MNPMFVAVPYCNILVSVVIETHHTRQNICGKRLLQQYKYFVAKELFQQNQNLWRKIVIPTDQLFVVTSYYDNIKCFVATA
jgi:hypothetical protein